MLNQPIAHPFQETGKRQFTAPVNRPFADPVASDCQAPAQLLEGQACAMKAHQLFPIENAMAVASAALDLDHCLLDCPKGGLLRHRLYDLAPNNSPACESFPMPLISLSNPVSALQHPEAV